MIQKLDELPNLGKPRNDGAFFSTSYLRLHKSMVVIAKNCPEGRSEIVAVYQVILIELRRFVTEMLGKIKVDMPPFLKFVKIIPVKNADSWAGR